MEIKNRQQFLIVLTAAAFGLLVLVDFIFPPISHYWSARQTQIKELRQKVADGKMLVRREAGIRAQWANMQTNALPANTSLAEQKMFGALDNWSRETGAEITSLMPQWRNDTTNYLTLDCRVETSGDISQLSKFLYAVENGPLALRVDSVELAAHDAAGQQLTLGMEVDGLALLPTSKK